MQELLRNGRNGRTTRLKEGAASGERSLPPLEVYEGGRMALRAGYQWTLCQPALPQSDLPSASLG